ncbi:MAG TPA: cytochrome c biogenesis protein ResB [Candidatus Deferrimicrobiaceae bacterium]|nr:cytochrome c biogenesis protein ResB [Candidatus Deferrimicrobiaceae bacterium]
MVEGKRTESPMDKVWKFFTSLKLAIFVIIILAVASIIGTIIEQNQPLEKYRQFYSDGTIRLFESLNLFDMYHSWWFLLLLVLLTVNLSCCTLDRLPRTVKVVRNPKTTLDENLEKSLSHVDRWKKKGGMEELADTYKTAMGSAFARPRVTENSGTLHLYAEKGVVSRFGVYVTHLSIIIIFIGAIIGNVFGFKGFANIVEGQSVRTIPTRGGANQVDLGFAVRCNKFRVDFYPTGQPKEYSSDLSVIEGGREVVRKTIEVNDPLQYKGIWFYQASYGPAGAASATVAVNSPDGGRMETFSLTPGQKVEIPGYGKVSGIDYQNDFQGLGPALLVVLEKHGKPPAEFWLLKAYPNFDRQRGDTRYLSFAGVDQIFYTGLQVAQDPGVNIVWVGCTLMVIGIMIAFFMSHQRLWIRLSRGGDGRVEVVLAGSTNKNRLAFEKRFEKIQADMKAVGA